MTHTQAHHLWERQKNYYQTGATLPVAFRIKQLKILYAAIQKHERDILEALTADLGKSSYEGFMCEIGLVLSEISYMLRHVKQWSRPKTVRTPLSQFAAHSFLQPIPYGTVLIMSPWNYPFLLSMEPLVNALAAGNTAVVKPSAYSPATSHIIQTLIADCFSPDYVAVVTGGREENQTLLDQPFDLIFFTGSQAVGKEVLRHAAERLTPVILELGGKSPCLVDASADIPLAAKRIVFGKYLNCGQTCVAPDYVLCEQSVQERFIAEVIKQIKEQYGENPLENPQYGKIINSKHFARLCGLIEPSKVVQGGRTNSATCQIEPTVMKNVSAHDAVMCEEIFGPILPIISFDCFDRVVEELKQQDEPLAFYLFSSRKDHIHRVVTELSYGGGCINDVVIHLATSEMGFGGVGKSGMGAYHGKAGFDAFSHTKSIVNKRTWLDLPMRYAPYQNARYVTLMRRFLK